MGLYKNIRNEAYKPLTCLLDSHDVEQTQVENQSINPIKNSCENENVVKLLERSTFVVDVYLQQLCKHRV
jgi:hypothetical protein